MNGKNLLWIIPLCFLVFGSMGYVKGTLDGANLMIDKCNSQYNFQNELCDLQCEFSDSVINTLEYYEKRCPGVVENISLMTDEEILSEFEKHGIEVLKDDRSIIG